MDFWFSFFVVAATALVGVCASGWWAFRAYRDGQFAGAWRWLRVLSLGGATTLERDLSDSCGICSNSMDAGEKVRTLSCDHVFHRGGISKCEDGIDNWLRTAPRMFCPVCLQTPRSVLPWKAPPPTPTTSEAPSYGSLVPSPLSSSGLANASPPESSSGLDDRDKPLLSRSQTA
ncbi:hypothetical protein BS78_06G142600 [Paspalum vaginatum]|nr:hypothetical protein BS78_06G142600 [Paspalum vaginatum]